MEAFRLYIPPQWGMFRMTKWYLDLVTRDGQALILYAAKLQILGWESQQGMLLLPDGSGPLQERRGSLGDQWPERRGEDLLWMVPALGLRGRWQGLGEPTTAELWKQPGKLIHWCCHGIALPAAVEVTGVGSWRGLGYAETLEMDYRGLRLPFRTLHWGRFQGECGGHATWIQWDEGRGVRWVWQQGRTVSTGEIHESGWESADGRVELSPGRVLRRAWVAQELFRTPLARMLPGFRQAREEKWLSRATWHGKGQKEEGWAIHERVTLG